ncbi:MAG: hypothetical protein DMG47_15275 [Acidobacteria bacterium]|nr:MAG: hypothetical protein DMG47_15275 [Acidobacteriota bacterium]PYT61677.1 MAG: hypothetical protein DMG46_03590 [Acidobacteriota bacterium]
MITLRKRPGIWPKLSLAWPAKFIAYAKQRILFWPRVDRDGETEFSFRARGNGITFTFSEKEWTALQKLFRRAWPCDSRGMHCQATGPQKRRQSPEARIPQR